MIKGGVFLLSQIHQSLDEKNISKRTENTNITEKFLTFWFGPSADMEGEELKSHTAAGHQGLTDVFWLFVVEMVLLKVVFFRLRGITSTRPLLRR